MRGCIRCGSPLLPNPIHTHWAHCPTCEPVWTRYVRDLNRTAYLTSLAHRAVTDTRGRPTPRPA